MEIGSEVEAGFWAVYERKEMFLNLYLSNAAQPRPLGRFQQFLDQRLLSSCAPCNLNLKILPHLDSVLNIVYF